MKNMIMKIVVVSALIGATVGVATAIMGGTAVYVVSTSNGK